MRKESDKNPFQAQKIRLFANVKSILTIKRILL